jgi:hypothetical protein
VVSLRMSPMRLSTAKANAHSSPRDGFLRIMAQLVWYRCPTLG